MGNVYPRVLVATPTYEGKDYMFERNWEAIKSFSYPNYDYIYLDNSNGTSYTSKLRKRGCKVLHVPRGKNSRQALANAQNIARRKAIDEGYDYLMFVESDLIPPKDTIQRLMNHGKAVTGATYLIGHEIKVPCIFFVEQKGVQNGTRMIRPSEAPSFLNQGLRMIHGMGLGCTLIRRDIFTRFPYWHDERFANKHSDVYFYMDLHNKGIPAFVDTDFMVPHFPSKWDDVKDR